ncbi:MAG: 2-oxoacid:acceptor oxidoreductase subunit alpha [Alphaproteobacteria bacterium]|nr:2-oxoacid:acceptor oxidoreductase subunit alpha [Alphaproteobacteria bacterium]
MNALADIRAAVRVNDFVLKIANVNGTGSASANGLLMKAIFRMGVPVVGKNLFPSNIQGLPTWYEIRLTKDSYAARAGETHFMVAMNAETYAQDIEEVAPGGYLLYDNTWPRPELHERAEVTAIGVPLARMCNAEFDNARTRVLMKNMAYVGAVAGLTGLDLDVIRSMVEEMFGTKAHLIEANMKAIQLGLDYVTEHYPDPISLKVEAMDKTAGHIMIDGNTAAALGCVYAGATFGAWYPITPSTSLMDGFKSFCEKLRIDPETGEKKFCIIQAEDELASVGMAVGAGWNGARAFTPTSGPGISLMSEFIGFAYYGEVPLVLFDVQRAGPSTGLPTRTQQCDLTLAAYASHGDTKHICVYPADPKECFEMAVASFDLAERFQTPVFFMTDLDIGMNDWMVPEFEWDDSYQPDRGKVLHAEDLEKIEKFYRYEDRDGDGVPYRTLPGEHPKGAYFTRGSGHNWKGGYTEDGAEYQEVLDRLTRKWESAADVVPGPVVVEAERETRDAIISIGGCDGAVREALDRLNEANCPVNYLRVRGFPFSAEIEAFIEAHDRVFVVEQNRDAQLRSLLINETSADKEKLIPLLDYAGMPANPSFITAGILAHCQPQEA